MSGMRKRSMDGVRVIKKAKTEVPKPTPLKAQNSSSSRLQHSPLIIKKKLSGAHVSRPSTPFIVRVVIWIRKNWFWFKYLMMLLLLVMVVVIIANKRSKTEIHLTSHIEYLELNNSFTAYTNPNEEQLGFDIIAVTDEVSFPIDAAGTRPKEEKSQGIITVYNNYSSEPQRLLPETRFESASGKIFKMGKQEIIVPGKQDESPGTIEVQIFAEKPGPEYNIDITDFSIPGFKDAGLSEKYESIYAVSKKPFTGGIITTEGYIEPSQREDAQIQLQQQLTERLALRLQKENTDNVLVLEKSAQLRFKESEFVADETTSKGLLTQKGTIVALAVSKPALNNYIIENYLTLSDNESAHVIDDTQLTVTINNEAINYNEIRTSNIVLGGKVLVKYNVSHEEFSAALLGVPKEHIESILRNNNTIDTARIDIFPPWKKSVSDSIEKIEIQVD